MYISHIRIMGMVHSFSVKRKKKVVPNCSKPISGVS